MPRRTPAARDLGEIAMKLGIGIVIVLAALAAAPASATAAPPAAQSDDRGAKLGIGNLVGAWEITIDLNAQGPGFRGLLTFTSDRLVLADEPGAFETTGHGAWSVKGRRTAAYAFRAFLGSASGTLTGQLKVSGTLRMQDDNTWTGHLVVEVLNPSGALLFSDAGTVTASRIVAD